MKFQIQNIGHIPHAEIDLDKKLIILCGANNTGKTYLAYSIYGFLRFLIDDIYTLFLDIKFISEDDFSDGFNKRIDILERFAEKKEQILNQIPNRYKKRLPLIFATNEDFFNNTRLKFEFDTKKMNHFLLDVEINHLIAKENIASNATIISLKKAKNDKILYITEITIPKEEKTDFKTYMGTHTNASRFINDSTPIKTQIISQIKSEIDRYFSDSILDLFRDYFTHIHIAPVERLVINIFSKEISTRNNELLEKMKNVKPLESIKYLEQLSRFSLPVKDNIDISLNLDIGQRFKSEFSYLADEIEKEILGGKVNVSEYNTMQFTPNETTTPLNFNMSASVIKSLASIVFYCRHLAQKNDFFIIDEPELNLHPDNQRKIARVIVQMINAGIKVMISTHSDYIIKELNNLMMLHIKDKNEEQKKDVENLMQKYGYKENQILDFEDVGVYLFTQNHKTGTNEVTPLEVTNTGFEVESIENEINKINNTAQTIYFTLHDNEN